MSSCSRRSVPLVDHDAWRFTSADCAIKPARGLIVAFRGKPDTLAPSVAGKFGEPFDQTRSDALPPQIGVNADLVDEEESRFVGMHQNSPTCKTDDFPLIQRNDDFVHAGGKKCPGPRPVDGIVESAGPDTLEHVCVVGTEIS